MRRPEWMIATLAACRSGAIVADGNDGAHDSATPSSSSDPSPSTTVAAPMTGMGTIGTGASSDGGHDSTGEPHQGCFVGPLPDIGDTTESCAQPQPLAQAPGCGDGVLAAGELCYRGVATRCRTPGGFSGFFVADFGNGRAIGYLAGYGEAVHLLPATAEGVLGGACEMEFGRFQRALTAGDLDGDDRPELLIMHPDDTGALQVYRVQHPVVFEPWTSSVVPFAIDLRFAEIDGAPPLDLIGRASGNYVDPGLQLLSGSADGTFAAATSVTLGLDIVRYDLEDLDGDGRDDIVALVLIDDDPYSTEIQVVLAGPGEPNPVTIEDSSFGYLGSPAAGRFDGDAIPDIAHTLDGRLVVRGGLGDGSFGSPVTTSLDPASWGLAAADVDGDGRDELVGGADVISFDADGFPLVDARFDIGQQQHEIASVEFIDINDDGLLDFILFSDDGQEPPSIHLVVSNP